MVHACNNDMKRALQLLFNPSIAVNVLFNEFAFIGNNFILGTLLEKRRSGWAAMENDNITTLTGSFTSLEDCNLIKIYSSSIQYITPVNSLDPAEISLYTLPDMNIEHASLDNINAAIFNFSGSNEDFKNTLKSLINVTNPYLYNSGMPASAIMGPPCKDSIYNILNNLINITAGNLALYNAEVLGKIGDVLCLANTSANINRIYFVCLKSIDYIGFPNIN